MSRAVLISVRPEWCALIVDGRKTIEVRKSKPNLPTPFKCYIYCTYGQGLIEPKDAILPNHLLDQKVRKDATWGNCVNGKVIGEFVCDGIYAVLKHPTIFAGHPLFFQAAVDESGLTHEQLEEYAQGKDLCGWHISDLVIYDKPRSLSHFGIKRAPQSWCYVEELIEGGNNE